MEEITKIVSTPRYRLDSRKRTLPPIPKFLNVLRESIPTLIHNLLFFIRHFIFVIFIVLFIMISFGLLYPRVVIIKEIFCNSRFFSQFYILYFVYLNLNVSMKFKNERHFTITFILSLRQHPFPQVVNFLHKTQRN